MDRYTLSVAAINTEVRCEGVIPDTYVIHGRMNSRILLNLGKLFSEGLWGIFFPTFHNHSLYKNLHENVYCSFLLNCQNLEAIKIFFSR